MSTPIFIGRTAEREPVYVEIEIEHQAGEYTLTDHSTVDGIDRISITWIVTNPGSHVGNLNDNVWSSAGQVPPENRTIEDESRSQLSHNDRELVEQAWLDWHLNDMQAGCDHMPTHAEIELLAVAADYPQRYGRPDTAGYALDNITCPETGYRYGHAWLSKVPPADIVAKLHQIAGN